MDIHFLWAESTSTVLRDVLESQIWMDADSQIHPCHPGVITAHIFSTDPLEISIKGKLVCSCGKSLATFLGSSDGSGLTWIDSDGFTSPKTTPLRQTYQT